MRERGDVGVGCRRGRLRSGVGELHLDAITNPYRSSRRQVLWDRARIEPGHRVVGAIGHREHEPGPERSAQARR